MPVYQLLSAVGPDRSGIVSQLTEILFRSGCNLEDSTMMRLGSEFGIQLIFTSHRKLSELLFSSVKKKFELTLQLKVIPKKFALAKARPSASARVTLHGADQAGIVYRVTRVLAEEKFNISDLMTHRTSRQRKVGYVLFIEGDLNRASGFKSLEKKLNRLAKSLRVTIRLDLVTTASL